MSSKWNLINADSGQKTWLTPRGIIEALGHFDTDPCCPSNMPWRTADTMLTKEDDGTTAEWRGRVWLNPPYGRESNPFIIRMATHKGGGIALLFARTDTKMWQDWIFPYAHSLLFMRGRIRFCDAQGNERQTSPAPSVLVAYSKSDADALVRSGIEGRIVGLRNSPLTGV